MVKSMEGGVKSLIYTMIHSPNEINREINGEIIGINPYHTYDIQIIRVMICAMAANPYKWWQNSYMNLTRNLIYIFFILYVL